MMEKPTPQWLWQDNLVIPNQNVSRSRVISLTQKSPQSSVLSVEREDIIIEYVRMCHHNVRQKFVFGY